MQLKNNKTRGYLISFSFFALVCLMTFNDFVSHRKKWCVSLSLQAEQPAYVHSKKLRTN